MPKRRYVSENAIFSKSINKISVGAEATFYRMLSISDDFGIVPSDEEELLGMLNYRGEREQNLSIYLTELLQYNLLVKISYKEVGFFIFNEETFDKYQSHIRGKRTKSEYTGIEAGTRDEFQEILRKSKKVKKQEAVNTIEIKDLSISAESNSKKFQEILEKKSLTDVTKGESKEYKVIKHKEGESEGELIIPKKLLDFNGFEEQWKSWLNYRKEKRKPLSERAKKENLDFLLLQPDPISVIKNSIRNEYQGLFEIKQNGFNGKSNHVGATTAAQHEAGF